MSESLETRLWRRVDRRGPDECWPWTGYINTTGYGQIGRGERAAGLLGTHVAAWESANGQRVPKGRVVRHACDNRPCCNPAHLSLGTPADNARDMKERGRARGARGMASPNARLTPEQVAEIRRRFIPRSHPTRKTGGSTTELAREFGISVSYVRDIVARRWRAYD